MKTILFTAIFFSVQLLCIGQDASELVKFEYERLDLGKVGHKELVKQEFSFINTSDRDVEIDLVSTCECTEAKWTQGPISPGEKGYIKFVFDGSKKEVAEPVDVDVYFLNVNPKTDNPYSAYLQYTFEFKD